MTWTQDADPLELILNPPLQVPWALKSASSSQSRPRPPGAMAGPGISCGAGESLSQGPASPPCQLWSGAFPAQPSPSACWSCLCPPAAVPAVGWHNGTGGGAEGWQGSGRGTLFLGWQAWSTPNMFPHITQQVPELRLCALCPPARLCLGKQSFGTRSLECESGPECSGCRTEALSSYCPLTWQHHWHIFQCTDTSSPASAQGCWDLKDQEDFQEKLGSQGPQAPQGPQPLQAFL